MIITVKIMIITNRDDDHNSRDGDGDEMIITVENRDGDHNK